MRILKLALFSFLLLMSGSIFADLTVEVPSGVNFHDLDAGNHEGSPLLLDLKLEGAGYKNNTAVLVAPQDLQSKNLSDLTMVTSGTNTLRCASGEFTFSVRVLKATDTNEVLYTCSRIQTMHHGNFESSDYVLKIEGLGNQDCHLIQRPRTNPEGRDITPTP